MSRPPRARRGAPPSSVRPVRLAALGGGALLVAACGSLFFSALAIRLPADAAPRKVARAAPPPGGSFALREEEPPYATTLVFPPFGHTYGFQRATGFKLRLFVGNRAHFRNPQGIAAVRLEAWDDPTTAKDDDELAVFGVNSGEGNIIYNRSLRSLDVFGSRGEGPGRFLDPEGIAADPQGNVYVVDAGNRRLVLLEVREGRLAWKAAVNGSGPSTPRFGRPRRIAIGRRGNLFVTDSDRNEIVILTPDGGALGTVPRSGSGGAWVAPAGVAALRSDERWSYRKGDVLFVADRDGGRLTKVSLSGRVEAEVEGASLPVRGARFDWLALDYYGNLYATDTAGSRIHKFDPDLRYLTTFGGPGSRDREFRSPTGITIWKRYGQTFVAEATGAQYYWVGTDHRKAEGHPRIHARAGNVLAVDLLLTERSGVRVEVTAPGGEHLGRTTGAGMPGENTFAVQLARPGLRGERLRIRVTLEPTYSSKTHFEKQLDFAWYP